MRIGFNSEIPPSSRSALEASADEREATFEERWRIGGFAFLGAFADLMTNLDANALAAEFVRGKIREIVADPATAELLCPRQPIGCKRMAVDSVGYYAAFNRPNVRLVDVSQHPIETVTPRGLVTGGLEYEFDTLVLATGFDAVTGVLKRMDLRGRRGLSIQDKWRDGPQNYLGLATAGFPNLFNVAGAGSTSAFTCVILSIEHHIDWIADCIAWLDAHGVNTIETTEKAESDWMAFVRLVATQTVFLSCNSWYLGANVPGKPRVLHAARERLPDVCGALRGGGARGLRGLCLRVNGFDKSGSPSPGREKGIGGPVECLKPRRIATLRLRAARPIPSASALIPDPSIARGEGTACWRFPPLHSADLEG